MNRRRSWVLGLAVFALWADLAVAQQQYTLTPSISVSETFDDNIYLAAKGQGRRSDYITTVSPGILFDMQTLRTGLQLNYVPSIVRYARDDENDTVRHLGRIAFRQSVTEHLRLDVTDDYIKSEDPLDSYPGVFGVRQTRNPYQRNTGEARGTYSFGPENTFSAGYRNSLLINEDPAVDDGTIHEPFLDLAYWFDKTNGLAFTYRYTVGTFEGEEGREPQADYTGHTPGVRYTRRFSPQTSGYASYTYATRDFDQDDVNVLSSQDFSVHSWMVGVDHQVDPQTNVTAGIGYFAQNSDSDLVEDESGFSYNAFYTRRFQRGRVRVGGMGGWDEQYLQAENRGFVKFYSAEASGDYFFLEKVSGYAGVLYRNNQYQDGLKENDFRGNAGIRWAFHRYISLVLDYNYTTRSSDDPLNEYDDNRLMLMVTASKPYKF